MAKKKNIILQTIKKFRDKLEFVLNELKFRNKALSFIGTGEDTLSDVAEEHDKYLDEAYIH